MYNRQYIDRLEQENQQMKQKIKIYESDTANVQMKEWCDKRVSGAVEREKRSYKAWMNALGAYKKLKNENTSLSKDNQTCKQEIQRLETRNEALERKDAKRIERIRELEDETDRLKETIQEKDNEIAALKEKLCEMQSQMDHDGTTNGIPTSQTPKSKQKIIPNTRTKTGRKKGGQPGHKKHCLGAFEEDEVTEIEEHTLDVCLECGGELEELNEAETKDEADYEVRIIKKRHVYKQYRCRKCGRKVRAKIPLSLKEQNQYGPKLQALVLSLVDLGFVSISRAQEIVTGILHKKLTPSEGFVGKVQKKASRLLDGFLKEVKEFCLVQRILYWDDTVIFVNTARACFRFYGNEKVAYYTAHAAKNAEGIEEDGILSALTEDTYLMHDHVKYNYRKEFLFKNIECIQHMERELERVFRASGHKWAEDMKMLIQETIHQRKEYLKAGVDSFTAAETNQFEEKLENLMLQAHREHKAEQSRYFSADELNAIKKLEEYRINYFAWVYDFTLPTTNNMSESGLRMTKTKQKVSGQFLKVETASEFAAVRTYTETCRKNSINEYEALERLMAGNPFTLKEILAKAEG